MKIHGTGGIFNAANAPLDVGNSGILRRFLTGILATQNHRYALTGDDSVMARPMNALQDALKQSGVSFFADGSFQGPFLPSKIAVDGTDSQTVSALLLAAANTSGTTTLTVRNPGELPWVDMTLYWLDKLKVPYERQGYSSYTVQGSPINAFNYTVPPDYSSAAFPWVGGIITGGDVRLTGLQQDDPQGDKDFFKMPLLEGGVFDLNRCIDAVPIAAVKACFAKEPVRLVNIEVARTKECDRLAVMTSELTKLGAQISQTADSLCIHPSKLKGAKVNSFGDHRIAMALTIAGFAAEGETFVNDIQCIDKTFPNFVTLFRELGGRIVKN